MAEQPHLGDIAKENDEDSKDKKIRSLMDEPCEPQTHNWDDAKNKQPHRTDEFFHHHAPNRTFYNHKLYSNQNSHHQQKDGRTGYSSKEKNEFADKRSCTSKCDSANTRTWKQPEKPGRITQKTRSLSTTTPNQTETGTTAELNEKRGRKNHRHRKSATDVRTSSNNSMSNGESFDYDEMELDEPFSESEDEYAAARHRALQKPCLAIPRGRIRSLSGTIPPVGFSPHWGGPTMCLSCLQFFQLPEMMNEFSAHLLSEHRIVIDGIDIIVDLKRYVEHWRQQFTKRPVNDVFSKVVPDEGHALFGKVDYYFDMSETVKEDYALRQRLAMRRLEEALACQQREREDCTFSMQCIFCRYTARGNRAKIIHHLYTIHHLNLGSPDNLVFVTEYIEHLREKISREECIYCENIYSDRNTLMEHMRKKNHKEVNPKNNYYDKFYIINYLELGKRWLDVLAEDFEDTMPTFADSDEEEEEESWHEWQEDNTGNEDAVAVCLFCDRGAESLEELTKHMKENHKFDLIGHIHGLDLDTYGRMKFVNFIRKRKFNTRSEPAAETKFAEIPEQDEWDKEENLVPMFGNDHLLWMLESWFLEQDDGEKSAAPNEGQFSIQNGGVVELETLVEESKKNTVPEVIAEELPDLTESILANAEMQESLGIAK